MISLKILLLVCFADLVLCDAEDEKIESKCKKYHCLNGYNYVDYFKVTSGHRSNNSKFEMHFGIKAASNGHVLLSTVSRPSSLESVYEIAIGAGGNTFSDLRRMRGRLGKSTIDTPNILDRHKYAMFWINVTDDGVIRIGKEGEDASILFYKDPVPFAINYFSFAAWAGVEATFLYDCIVEQNSTDDSVMVERELTPLEKLRQSLLIGYDPYVRPIADDENAMNIFFQHQVKSVRFNVAKGELRTYGTVILHWTDDKLQWDPNMHENQSILNFNYKEIWMPEIFIYNSLELEDLRVNDMPLVVNSRGGVVRAATYSARTKCAPGPKLSHWPRDEHNCTLIFGLWSLHSMLTFFIMDFPPSNETKFIGREKYVSSEWELVDQIIESKYTKYSPYVQFYEDDSSNDTEHNTVNINMLLKRKHKTFSMTFYTPFIYCMLMILSTFWFSSIVVKMSILCLDLIFVLIFLSQIISKMPMYTPHTPNIICFYMWAISGICLSIAVNVLLLYATTEPRPWLMNESMKRFLISSPFTTALGVPEIKMKETYRDLNDDESDDEEQYWNMLTIMVDRSMFIVYTIALASMFFVQY